MKIFVDGLKLKTGSGEKNSIGLLKIELGYLPKLNTGLADFYSSDFSGIGFLKVFTYGPPNSGCKASTTFCFYSDEIFKIGGDSLPDFSGKEFYLICFKFWAFSFSGRDYIYLKF